VRRLEEGVTAGQVGAGLAPPEAQLTKQALALTDAEVDGVSALEEGGEGLAIPEIPREPYLLGPLTERRLDGLQLALREPTGTARVNPFRETGQPFLIKAVNPVLNAPCRIPEETAHFGSGHSLGDEQQSVEPMIIARFIGTADLILQSEDHVLGVRYGQRSHGGPRSPLDTRNYL
jgi:hypothetical protein